MSDDQNLLIGQLIGRVDALVASFQSIQATIVRIEDALVRSNQGTEQRFAELIQQVSRNEKEVAVLKTKVALIGLVTGMAGSLIGSAIIGYLFNK